MKEIKKVFKSYRAFYGFGQAKIPDVGLVLGLSQFSILPQLPSKILLDSKVVKIDPKIIIKINFKINKTLIHCDAYLWNAVT